jgi:hypothetical protein
MSDGLRTVLWQILLWGALPAWVAAGFIDWLQHRRSRISMTSGAPEAAMHLVAYALTAVPVLLGLYFEIDALVLVVMAVCVVAHLVLGWIDTGYTQPRRTIGAVEQAAHPFLELTPVFAMAMVGALYADAWGAGDWSLRLRTEPLPRGPLIVVTLALVPGFVLMTEELVRCIRIRGQTPFPGNGV